MKMRKGMVSKSKTKKNKKNCSALYTMKEKTNVHVALLHTITKSRFIIGEVK
jgi:hypothetical protein